MGLKYNWRKYLFTIKSNAGDSNGIFCGLCIIYSIYLYFSLYIYIVYSALGSHWKSQVASID